VCAELNVHAERGAERRAIPGLDEGAARLVAAAHEALLGDGRRLAFDLTELLEHRRPHEAVADVVLGPRERALVHGARDILGVDLEIRQRPERALEVRLIRPRAVAGANGDHPVGRADLGEVEVDRLHAPEVERLTGDTDVGIAREPGVEHHGGIRGELEP
jgi:hypothetical protein